MRRLAPLLLALLLALVAAPAAQAARDQEATFQDDNELIYTDRASMAARLDTLKALGVDRLRLTILWMAIAPDPMSRIRPSFDATDPDAYPAHHWAPYDAVLEEAAARGLKVNFNVTGPSPLWANKVPPREDIADNYEPSPGEFAQFVVALGRRYSGDWPPGPYVQAAAKIPRVDYWSIWNEPNHSGWLTPTWRKSGKRFYERSAVLYRELLDAAWGALALTGHGKDTILFGETAPSGSADRDIKRFMKPMVFVRALYCVDRRGRRLKGARRKLLGCGKSASAFRRAHPALFGATGYAHHPYQLLTAPSVKPKDKDMVTMAVLGRLTRVLDRTMRRYKSRKRFPLYLTEYGYQTPPDPVGVPLAFQGAYLNQSEYMAWRNRRVRTLAQFLLVDDGDPIGLTFQSGLISRDGKRKPSFAAYRIPIWVSGKGSRKRVWGVLRPAAAHVKARAKVQVKTGKRWRTVKRVRARGRRNIVTTRVRVRRGAVRIVYGKLRSRAALVL